MDFLETLEISHQQKDPFYLVWLVSFDKYIDRCCVSYFRSSNVRGDVIGSFDLFRNTLPAIVKGIISSHAEEIIMSSHVILKELPVFMTWDGESFTTPGSFSVSPNRYFVRRV